MRRCSRESKVVGGRRYARLSAGVRYTGGDETAGWAMTGPGQAQNMLGPPAVAAIFLVITVRPGAEGEVRGLLADVPGLNRAVGFRSPEDGLSCVVGVGAGLWDR